METNDLQPQSPESLPAGQEPENEAQQPADYSAEPGAAEQETQQQPGADDQQQPHQPPAWAQRRIDQLTREKYEARRQADDFARQLAAQQQPGDPATMGQQPAQPNMDPVALARQMVQQQQFDTACNTVYEQGKAAFGDFDAALATFGMLGGLPQDFLSAATQLPNAHAVLYELGRDPDNASRVLSLPPIPMAMELARLSEKAGKPAAKPVSSAPAPIRPIDGSGSIEKDPDKMSMDEWVKWRESNRS